MIFVALVQTLVPAALLAWLGLFPMRRRWAHLVQILCVGLVLIAFALLGLWMLPPWWAPYLFGALFALIVARQFLRPSSGTGDQSDGWVKFAALGAVALLAAYSSYLGVGALTGRNPAGESVADIAMPLPSGIYLVAQGGANRSLNEHFMTLDESVPRFAAWRGQSKGLDIIRIDRFGLRATGLLPEDPAEYYTFDTPVLAPCDGPVVEALDGVRDMPVPQMDREHMLGNHVIVQCGDVFVVLAHFKQGSLLVTKGQMIKAGEMLGAIGNSGNSAEPHLHIHAQRDLPATAPISGEPLALRLGGRFYVRNDRIVVD
jgi:hypothetical protein